MKKKYISRFFVMLFWILVAIIGAIYFAASPVAAVVTFVTSIVTIGLLNLVFWVAYHYNDDTKIF